MKITVCIGSSCHIKGSHAVVEGIKRLISENALGDKITVGGTFCMQNCQAGVCVAVDNKIYSVKPDTVESFFNEAVLSKL